MYHSRWPERDVRPKLMRMLWGLRAVTFLLAVPVADAQTVEPQGAQGWPEIQAAVEARLKAFRSVEVEYRLDELFGDNEDAQRTIIQVAPGVFAADSAGRFVKTGTYVRVGDCIRDEWRLDPSSPGTVFEGDSVHEIFSVQVGRSERLNELKDGKVSGIITREVGWRATLLDVGLGFAGINQKATVRVDRVPQVVGVEGSLVVVAQEDTQGVIHEWSLDMHRDLCPVEYRQLVKGRLIKSVATIIPHEWSPGVIAARSVHWRMFEKGVPAAGVDGAKVVMQKTVFVNSLKMPAGAQDCSDLRIVWPKEARVLDERFDETFILRSPRVLSDDLLASRVKAARSGQWRRVPFIVRAGIAGLLLCIVVCALVIWWKRRKA